MPLNVIDSTGNHIGVVVGSYPTHHYTFTVALTDLTVEDLQLNKKKIYSVLGLKYRIRNIFGKVKEEQLKHELQMMMDEHYADQGFSSLDSFLMYKFLKCMYDHVYDDLDIYVQAPLTSENCRGFILVNIHQATIKDNAIIIEDSLEYTYEETVDRGLPIYCKIVDYPVFRTDMMGALEGMLLGADASDLGGRNHAHMTELSITSGNYVHVLVLPIQMMVKKHMTLQLYIDKNKIRKVFCGEAIYEF